MRLLFTLAIAAAVGLLSAGRASAQATYIFQQVNGDEYFDDNNWVSDDELMLNFIPDGSLEPPERASIGDDLTAVIDSDGAIAPGQVILGPNFTETGTLEIRNNGVLNVSSSTGDFNSGVNVGGTGTGILTVLPGGTLSAVGPIVSAAGTGSIVTVGDSSGAGTATVTSGSATFNATTRVFPNAALSTTGNLILGGGSNYTVEVSGASSGAIDVGATGFLNGTVNLNFTGPAPAVGTSWTVLEAASFSGAFTNVTSSATLPLGQALIFSTGDAGGGRVEGNVSLEEVLVVEVNRDTGMATITQPGGTSIELDSYFVSSDSVGALTPGGAASFNGQPSFGTDWFTTDSGPSTIGELKAAGSVNINNGDAISLGTIYDPFAGAFGEVAEDLGFTYSRPSDGAIINGVVTYTGTTVNSLILQVDPNTNEVVIRNTSQTSVDIDGYDIQSGSDSLSLAGWDSLDDQDLEGSGAWLELLAPALGPGQIGEFNVAASTTLAPGASLSLGEAWVGDGTGERDLAFNFGLFGEEDLLAGVVIYEPIMTGLKGDSNGDGVVNTLDIDAFVLALTNPAQYSLDFPAVDFLANNDIDMNGVVNTLDIDPFVLLLTGGVTATPEPSSLALLLVGAFGVARSRRR